MFKKKPLIILTGPTAVGKTELSIRLAKKVGGEIISADSMQVYKYMDIGTAKIKVDEMQGVRHYLVDEFEPDEEFNVVKFKDYTTKYMDEIYNRGKIPIIVGGTGFYIQAVLYDIEFVENEVDNSYRMELEELARTKGSEYLHRLLMEIDKKSAMAIHSNNTKKVIRALEYYKQTNSLISEHNEEQRKRKSPYEFAYFVLNDTREIIYNKIDQRVDKMIEQGLIDEVKWLNEKGYAKSLTSMQGLGYKEILSYLEGECTKEEAIYILKRDTRHFAKRQITWFKREKEVIWVNKSDYQDNEMILNNILNNLKEKSIYNKTF